MYKEMNMSKNEVPQRVRLRDERKCTNSGWLERCFGPISYSEYSYDSDPELDAIIALADGNGLVALRLWYEAAKPKLLNRKGVHLIAGPLQDLLQLPVRQIYLDTTRDEIYRIDPEESGIYGRPTSRLFPV